MKIYSNLSEFPGAPNSVVTTGTFDGVHLGHQKVIRQLVNHAKSIGGESVIFTFDPHPRHVIFPDSRDLFLLQSIDEKAAEIAKLGVDHLIVHPFSREFSRISATNYVRNILVKQLQTKVLIIGHDHQFGRNREGSFQSLKEAEITYNFQVVEIPALDLDEVSISSTKIRLALQNGDVKTANQYLSRPYTMEGTVVEGKKMGKTLGFPTANIQLNQKHKLIPKKGVYIVEVQIGDSPLLFPAVMNIGVQPTIEDNLPPSIEVHLLNFNRDLYGETVLVHFLQFIRDEKKFSNLNDLKTQIKKDVATTQMHFSH